MIRILLPVLLVMIVVMESCKPAQTTTSRSQGGKYHEDLSSLRPAVKESGSVDSSKNNFTPRDPKAYMEPRYTVNAQLDAVLDSIDRINLTRRFVEGFTIQVYAGQKREDALSVRKDMTIYLPKIDSEVQYVQPNFRVKAGRYLNRLEAQKDYHLIRQYFPNAIIIPDKIAIN
ncbi:MAG: SPOR domain-containing protein [Cyclobacteriaceae bacterium]|nr:SPOR domain-containing protein [Cyclobacteriaceae bacterium]